MNALRTPALLFTVGILALTAAHGSRAGNPSISWKKTVLDTRFRAEGVAVADVNRDGRPDVMAGNLWYEAPARGEAWKPHEIRPVQEFNAATGYSNCFLSFSADVNGDNWPDQLVIGFPGDKAVWRQNPATQGGPWLEFPITTSACNETPIYADLDGDDHSELVTPFKESQMAFYNPGARPTAGFAQTLIGEPDAPATKRFSHGLGVGDLNGDKRPDILCTDGYWEAPKKGIRTTPWKFVPAKLGPACATMYTHDFDGDGDMDVFSSSAHQIGVWWWEQTKGAAGPEFKQHTIDDTFSQSHSVVMADINGDKQPDFVTGKRWWAHGPNGDVNPGDPAVLYWFEHRREDSQVKWTRHQIDSDSGVGTQFVVTQMNRDRHPDVVIANKKGVFVFEQQRGR